MLSECNRCHEPIRWDKMQRERLGITGPLNEDGRTAHYCYARVKDKEDVSPTENIQKDKVESLPSSSSLVSLTQEETRMLKDFVTTHTWPVHFSDEEIKMLREIIQVFQELKKK